MKQKKHKKHPVAASALSRTTPGGPLAAYGFSRRSFEHLLFPLHGFVYRGLKRAFSNFSIENPEGARALLEVGRAMPESSSDDPIRVTPIRAHQVPRFDIRVDIQVDDRRRLHQSTRYKTYEFPHARYRAGDRMLPCQLIIRVNASEGSETYMVPIAYLMQGMEAMVCRPGAYQLYRHGLLERTEGSAMIATLTEAQRELHTYIGITHRSWQKRYQEHRQAAKRGSHLRFHRALRGELFPVRHREHEVVRAGLTEDQALLLEEREVEAHSLAPMPGGLNMIPGGRAGIRYLQSATGADDRRLHDVDRIEAVIEEHVARNLRQGTHEGDLAKIAELWRTDLHYRIKAMTSQHNRIAYAEIRAARVYDASGWPIEKILDRLNVLRRDDQRRITIDQLKQLLGGKTYSSIPHVMVDDV